MNGDTRIKFDLDGLDHIVRVQCMAWGCHHHLASSYRCNLKHITIKKDGTCGGWQPDQTKTDPTKRTGAE